MNEIICPHCSKAFKIDETGYADIVRQVHDVEFEQALHERLSLAAQEKQTAVQLAEAKSQYLCLIEDIKFARNEVNCRIEHGANSNGHLDYVQTQLTQIIDAAMKEAK